jgi:DNA-binding winged helix-turn-helix (wHTH) protein
MLDRPFFNLLRALRDSYKYRLTYLLATRRPLKVLAEPEKFREFDDLFVANQIWLNPLSESDARWTVHRFEERHNQTFDDQSINALLTLSGHHPGLLVALASAWQDEEQIEEAVWTDHPRVVRECELLWGDLPETLRSAAYDSPITDRTLHEAGVAVGGNLFSPVFELFVRNLQGTELRLDPSTGEIFRGGVRLDVALTPKEHELLAHMLEHQNVICEKDDLIQAVWTEDKVFDQGVRDDSLAQLVRRLRVKIEPDPSTPSFLLTIPGRGYRLIQPE